MREHKPDVDTVTIELDVIGKDREHKIGSLSVRFREVDGENRHQPPAAQLKIAPQPPKPETDTTTVTFGDNGHDGKRENDSLRIPAREMRKTPKAELIDEYEPEGGLVRRVRIMRWPSRYSFYEQFRFDSKRYAEVTGVECPHVDFFSYTPQYRQMSKAQLAYYFWWRENAIRGEWLPAAFSYILLYVYEIINLNEIIEPNEGLRRLVSVWLAYRGKHKVLDKYLSEWVADYCLIHRLRAPREALSPIMPAVMENASFREFYMAGDDGGITTETLIELSSDYNWQKSKYAAESAEMREQYRRHIPAAVGYVASRSGDERFSTHGMKSAVVSRDAFCGSLCAHNVKCRIDIEYLSFVRSRELRTLMTELVKYCENKLRAALGIRSRLRVNELDERFRTLADEYFDREFPQTKKETAKSRAEAEERAYDAAYDALTHGVDAAGAAEIERASWASTELLATEFEPEAVSEAIPGNDETAADFQKTRTDTSEFFGERKDEALANDGSIFARLDVTAAEYLRLLLENGGAAASAFCRENAVYEDEVASRINEAAADIIGDIILEPDANGGYVIIEDYIDEIR